MGNSREAAQGGCECRPLVRSASDANGPDFLQVRAVASQSHIRGIPRIEVRHSALTVGMDSPVS